MNSIKYSRANSRVATQPPDKAREYFTESSVQFSSVQFKFHCQKVMTAVHTVAYRQYEVTGIPPLSPGLLSSASFYLRCN